MHSSERMSNQSEEDQQIIVEKIRSNYPDLTLNDYCGNKQSFSSQNTLSVSASPLNISTVKTNDSVSIVSTLGSPNFDTTCSELKQAIGKNLPPYTNTIKLGQNSVRINKNNTPKTINKTVQSKCTQVREKATSIAVTEPSVSSSPVLANNKQITCLPLSRTSNQISLVQNKQGDKIISVNNMPGNEDKSSPSKPKTMQESIIQISYKSDVIEKNIHKRVLTVTPCSNTGNKNTSIVSNTLTAIKDTKLNSVNVLPKTTSPSLPLTKNNVSPKENLYKNIAKNVNIRSEIQKNDLVKGNTSNNIAKPSFVGTSELASKSVSPKAITVETSKGTSPKIKEVRVTVTSPSDNNIRNSDLVSKCIPSKSSSTTITTPVTKVNSKTTTISVTSNSPINLPKPSTFLEANVQVPNRRLTLTSLHISALSESKELMEALNSGSNVNLTESVTISNQTLLVPTPTTVEYTVLQTVPDQKLRMSNETAVQTVPKQQDNSSIFISSNEVENSEIVSLRRKIDEPECLTISSDDETEEPEQFISSLSDTSDISVSIMNKEPLIEKDERVSMNDPSLRIFNVLADGSFSETDLNNLLNVTSGDGYVNLNCRTVRIGSYKITPRSPVTLSQYGLRIVIPDINNVTENIELKIPIHEIIKVLIHFGRALPVIFYYVSTQTGAKVRDALNMVDNGEFYFDPVSSDESQRRITLLPEKFSETSKRQIEKLYVERVLAELNLKEANELLVRSAPKDVQKVIKQVPPNPVQTIMVYPPPPIKGGISINTEDYSCLAEDVFLNDVIIDFYLKYLYNHKLSEEDKQKTHIFSSFFYKRLTDKATPIPRHLQNSRSIDNTITAAEIRHSRVKNWTKNIDIFSKDYIIIPLNENQHWFLAIICFPGLSGPITFDNKPIEIEKTEVKVENTTETSSNIENQTITIGSTTITPLQVESSVQKYSTVDNDNEGEDRDEADGADEDVNFYLNTSEESEEEYSETEITNSGEIKRKPGRSKPERIPIKQPCILIFDSLAGASRARIIATLRDYLYIEYKVKHKEERDFSKNIVKGACPKVPQQNNYTDCGLFVLEYVETFFTNKITDFHIPIKTLRNWFDPEIVSRKRYNIQQLLLRLMHEQNIDIDSLNLPNLNLSPRSTYDSDDIYTGEYYDDEEGEIDNSFEYDDLDVEDIEEHHAQLRFRRTYQDESDDTECMEEEEYGTHRYAYLDSDPEGEGHGIEDSEDDYSDEDIMYKDLENLEMMKAKRRRRTDLCRRMKVECEDPSPQEDDSDEQVSNERLCSENTEDVIISRAITISNSSNTRIRPSGNSGDQNPSPPSDKNQLAALKAARPFGDVDSSNSSGCSSNKKFRLN